MEGKTLEMMQFFMSFCASSLEMPHEYPEGAV